MKHITHRIAYYLRKVAEKGSIHPSRKQPVRFKYRNERLMVYKKRMHELIEANKH
jgi:predicted transcriptional regulator